MPIRSVLIVEDSLAMAALYAEQLGGHYRSSHAASLAEARRALVGRPDAVLLDLRLPDGHGSELLAELRANDAETVVVVMTAHGSIDVAVEAMRAGADDFLVKPFAPARLLTTLENSLEKRRLTRLLHAMSPSRGEDGFEGFVGKDLSMEAVYRIVEQAARSKATVFVTGESGTGKELCAEAIHRRSPRRAGPFVALNCASLPHDLIESELFGHVRGAFTGAVAEREGAIARADGGTLFLDEVCEMDLSLQAKLLRVLQTGMVRRLGSDRESAVDVRIVCATNRSPEAEVAAGRFREDLFYRLYVIPVQLPPLRERGEDVLLVSRHLLAQASREEGRSFTGFDEAASRALLDHRWPGNVRQLQNVIRQVVVLHDGPLVTAAMLPADLRSGAGAAPGGIDETGPVRPLDIAERELIERAIAACGGNMTEAAQRLGINVKTIYRKRRAWSGGA